jgi:hypothetical protein
VACHAAASADEGAEVVIDLAANGRPKRRRGRQSPAAEVAYRKQVADFCALIRQIQSTMDFAVGSRGWCYILERHGPLKGNFDDAQKLINACRKSGDLPLNVCAEGGSRERLDNVNVEDQVQEWIQVSAQPRSRRVHTDPRALPVIELRTGSEWRGMMRTHHPIFKVMG